MDTLDFAATLFVDLIRLAGIAIGVILTILWLLFLLAVIVSGLVDPDRDEMAGEDEPAY